MTALTSLPRAVASRLQAIVGSVVLAGMLVAATRAVDAAGSTYRSSE